MTKGKGMRQYRVKIKAGKITSCKEAIKVHQNCVYHPETGVFSLRDKKGRISSLVCPANSMPWAQRTAMEFLEKESHGS